MFTEESLLQTMTHMRYRDHNEKLIKAIECGDTETALGLIENRTISDSLYRTGFWVVSGGANLLEKTAPDRDSPLECAAKRGNIPVLRALINAGVRIDTRTYSNWTPLQHALFWREEVAALELINAGADVNIRMDNDFFNRGKASFFPLHTAVRNKLSLSVVKALVDKGAKVNVANGHHNILVDAVVNYNDADVEIIEYLMQQGADPNRINTYKHDDNNRVREKPALYHALQQNKLEIAKCLLMHNADIYIKDSAADEWNFRDAGYELTPEMISIAKYLFAQLKLTESQEPIKEQQPVCKLLQ